MPAKSVFILGIESSCDDTAAAVSKNDKILANIISNQDVHKIYGGVVPELASRAHQQNIVPVVDRALKEANISKDELDAVAFTRGPGLLGSLLVGASFAKAFALALNIPIIEVDHMRGHILSHFIREDQIDKKYPIFPFLCLIVSGGHTQIVKVNDYLSTDLLGETTDDAAGEAFDKIAKILGFAYPGGPIIDKLAQQGDPHKFIFPHPKIPNLDFSFSGLKTAFLNFIKSGEKESNSFIEINKFDICASIQNVIVEVLTHKLIKATEFTGIKEVAIAGGVAANSGLRNKLLQLKKELNWNIYIPRFEYCTDNAAMIAITAYYKFLNNEFASQDISPQARL